MAGRHDIMRRGEEYSKARAYGVSWKLLAGSWPMDGSEQRMIA
jgi:hypothetical protein